MISLGARICKDPKSYIFTCISWPAVLWLALIREAFALWFLEKETLILVPGNLDDSHQQLEKMY